VSASRIEELAFRAEELTRVHALSLKKLEDAGLALEAAKGAAARNPNDPGAETLLQGARALLAESVAAGEEAQRHADELIVELEGAIEAGLPEVLKACPELVAAFRAAHPTAHRST
jgi:hypothetical protein